MVAMTVVDGSAATGRQATSRPPGASWSIHDVGSRGGVHSLDFVDLQWAMTCGGPPMVHTCGPDPHGTPVRTNRNTALIDLAAQLLSVEVSQLLSLRTAMS